MADLTDVVVVGAGWHAHEVHSYILEAGDVRLLGLIDDFKPRGPWLTTEILGGFHALAEVVRGRGKCFYITATGDNATRRKFVEKVEALELALEPWRLIHARSASGYDVQIGPGTCVAPGAVITTRTRIGAHCILNVNTSVAHDCEVGDFVNVNPGAVIAGNVRVGTGVYIGAGATIIDKVSVGAWSTIGAGAVVIEDIPDHVTAVGVPARIIKRHTPGASVEHG